MAVPSSFSDSPLSDLVRRLKKTVALEGVEIIPGAAGMARQGSPWRVVVWPHDGEFVEASDRSVSLYDDRQTVIVELWGRGSSTGGDEATLQDWNAAWALLVRFTQALAEQGVNPTNTDSPGFWWSMTAGPKWNRSQDTTQNGTSIQVLCEATFAIPAASTDLGHVGDNWSTGEGTSYQITRT